MDCRGKDPAAAWLSAAARLVGQLLVFFCDSTLLPRDCRFSFIAWNTVSMHPAFLAEVHSDWAVAKRARLG